MHRGFICGYLGLGSGFPKISVVWGNIGFYGDITLQ